MPSSRDATKPHPKPEPRKAEKERGSRQLSDYRRRQVHLAIMRDRGLCQICLGKGVREIAVDVHHIFGRSRHAGSWREDHTALICVCRECHPAPLYSHDWDSDHEVVVLAREINGKDVD